MKIKLINNAFKINKYDSDSSEHWKTIIEGNEKGNRFLPKYYVEKVFNIENDILLQADGILNTIKKIIHQMNL